LLRPGVPAAVEDMIEALRTELISSTVPLEGELGELVRQGVELAIGQFLDLCGQEVDVPDLRVYRVLGRQQVRLGQSIDAVQSAYRIGARVAWSHLVAEGEAVGLQPRVMYAIAEAIFVYIDRLSAASVAGFAEEQSAQEGVAQARRQALVELLVRPRPATPAELGTAAEAAGWPVPATVAVVIAEGDPVVLARRAPVGTTGGSLQGLAVLLVPDPEGPGRAGHLDRALASARALVGPTVPGSQVTRSLQRARIAWPLHLAGLLGPAGVARTGDHLLGLLLAGAPDVAQDLVQRRLSVLHALAPGPRQRALETVRAWLDAQGDTGMAAEALHVHPQTVRYRMGLAREVLGDALDSSTGRLELHLALRAQEQQAALTHPPGADEDTGRQG
jgi:hypothetical protein